MPRARLLSAILFSVILAATTPGLASVVRAASPSDVTRALEQGDIYIAPSAISHGVATTADRTRLQNAVDQAARSGVNEKIAIVSSYPSKYNSTQDATVGLRQKLGFDGILVMVTPQAIGISNALLTRRDIELIDRTATSDSRCDANKPVGCALLAAGAAVPAYLDEVAIMKAAGSLQGQDVVITPGAIARHLATAADGSQLDAAVRRADSQGVTLKYLFVAKYPEGYASATDAANALADHINLSGVLILGTPDGLGLGSSLLSNGDRNKIEAQAGSCTATSLVPCAIRAGDAAVPVYKSAKAHQDFVNLIITIIVLVIVLAIIGFFIWLWLRNRRKARAHLADLHTAAANTLGIADTAIPTIEAARPLDAAVQKAYDAALALRDRARDELDKGHTAAQLTQANQDAAQAALAVQGVMKTLKLPLGTGDPLTDEMPHRCFYCGHTDRPPYTTETIKDGKGNSMTVDVCAEDARALKQGQKPKVATVQENGHQVPWWAVSTDPYYYRYGGVGWQYWLPYTTGVNVDQWYGGAWNGSYTQPKPAAKEGWDGSSGDRDTRSDVAEGHLSGTASWGDSDKSSGDW